MIYPSRFEEKIGFNKIRALLEDACISSMGKSFVAKVRFSSNRVAIENMLEQADEFCQIIKFGKPFPSEDYIDMREELAKIEVPGSYIDQESLFDLKISLKTIGAVYQYLEQLEQEKFPRLKSLIQELTFPEEILEKSDQLMDDKGEIRDHASEKLFEIRKTIASKQRQVLKAVRKAFEQAKKAGWVPENAEITVRNGRSVIPVKASDKRALKGFIHDESSTGQTVFIEPGESFEMNNEIRELENDERREIIKILTRFADLMRPYLPDLFRLYRFLGLVDFIRAKALLSIELNANKPVLTTEKKVVLHHAVHPLLFLSHQQQNKEVVPLDMELDTEKRILVISGPNAGGKSVCLKTTGLLQYMVQCGLLVPVKEDSEFFLFDKIFIDIGDEQSLENDLSTYSSHLLNMKYFLRHADGQTLFLIDEFGTGTEPQLGGAIAEAVLEELNKKEAFGVVTTHYTNLKIAADKNPGMINGAMLFDSKELKPLFKLQIGKPGSSFTFEIARKIGFPPYVLERAKRKIGKKAVHFDQQLRQLEMEKQKVEKKEKELQRLEQVLKQEESRYAQQKAEVHHAKKELLEQARKEALQIIEQANKAVEKTIREIKEAKAEKNITKKLRQELSAEKEKIKKQVDEQPEVAVNAVESSPEEIKPGDWVKFKDSDIVGELISTDGEEAVVNVNSVRLRTTLDKLEKSMRKPSVVSGSRSKKLAQDMTKRAANFNLTIDLRGKRADEAMSLLKKYLDDAVMLGIKEVEILHGKGNGILRQIIREYLSSLEEVKHFGDAPIQYGGAGITRVSFK